VSSQPAVVNIESSEPVCSALGTTQPPLQTTGVRLGPHFDNPFIVGDPAFAHYVGSGALSLLSIIRFHPLAVPLHRPLSNLYDRDLPNLYV